MGNKIIKPVQTETHFSSRYGFKYGLNSGPRSKSGWPIHTGMIIILTALHAEVAGAFSLNFL